jgi:hypothetical protein
MEGTRMLIATAITDNDDLEAIVQELESALATLDGLLQEAAARNYMPPD